MHSYFMETISKTGIFIICAQVLIHFRPKASYEKYLKMLVSAMILIQLLIPVSELFTGVDGQTLAERVAWFESQLTNRMQDATLDYKERLEGLEEKQRDAFSMETIMGTDIAESKGEGGVSVDSVLPIEISIEEVHIHAQSGGVGDAGVGTGE